MKKTLLKTNQNNPAVKKYVAAVRKTREKLKVGYYNGAFYCNKHDAKNCVECFEQGTEKLD